jgi:hypothetical protein
MLASSGDVTLFFEHILPWCIGQRRKFIAPRLTSADHFAGIAR